MIETAIAAAKEAGAYLKENVGKFRHLERKIGQETNLVTEIDKGSEKLIISRIRERYPDHSILGEEGGASAGSSEYRWIIDPLDGTTNFTHGLPLYSVTIGVEYRGEIIAGVVYDPNQDEMFSAEKGSGAFLNGKRISVTKTTTLIEALLVTGFPYNVKENPGNVVQHFVEFLPLAQGVRRLGSAALDLAYVAAGRFDGYWEIYLHPWDKAGGILLVQEAGGIVTDFVNEGSNLIYQPNTLATNGPMHAPMLEVLAKNYKKL